MKTNTLKELCQLFDFFESAWHTWQLATSDAKQKKRELESALLVEPRVAGKCQVDLEREIAAAARDYAIAVKRVENTYILMRKDAQGLPRETQDAFLAWIAKHVHWTFHNSEDARAKYKELSQVLSPISYELWAEGRAYAHDANVYAARGYIDALRVEVASRLGLTVSPWPGSPRAKACEAKEVENVW